MSKTTEINGFILVDKKEDITSYDVIRKIKKILRELNIKTKIGHAGTLDPFATGLLVIMLGKYTRLSDYVMDAFKVYSGTIDVGVKTDTLDHTGNILKSEKVDEETILKIIDESNLFTGEFMQTPPQYSALKHNGKPLYEYARQGEFVYKESRKIFVKDFEVYKEDDAIKFRTTVSKGTYVRTLIEDYFEKYNSLASLRTLRRESSGAINVNDAIEIDDLNEDNFFDNIILIDDFKNNFDYVELNDDEKSKLYNGIRIETDIADCETLLLKDNGTSFALGKVEDGLIKTICFLGERWNT